MNDEEKKAIEDLRGYLKWNDKNSFSRLPRDNHIETVLNLIDKQQDIINKAIEYIEQIETSYYGDDGDNYINCCNKSKIIEILKGEE